MQNRAHKLKSTRFRILWVVGMLNSLNFWQMEECSNMGEGSLLLRTQIKRTNEWLYLLVNKKINSWLKHYQLQAFNKYTEQVFNDGWCRAIFLSVKLETTTTETRVLQVIIRDYVAPEFSSKLW